MERIRQLGDAIKTSYNKTCCIKVGVGVGVAVLLVVVIVVAATVATRGGGDDGGGGGGGGGDTGNQRGDGSSMPSQPIQLQHQFKVELPSSGFSQIIAVDDVNRKYVIEINGNEHYIIYLIVDFPKKQHLYVIVEKGTNATTGATVEKSVLLCESSPFERGFIGTFTSSSALKDGGNRYEDEERGRTVVVNAVYTNAPYNVSSTVASVLNGSCSTLSPDHVFKWGSELSKCGDNTTLFWDLPCDNSGCPDLPKTSQTIPKACTSFRQCNHLMARCYSSWSLSDYDGLPYCLCRRNIIADLDNNIQCSTLETGTETDRDTCEIPKKDIVEFETAAACYCRYSLSRIFPVLGMSSASSANSVTWEMSASVITAPARQFDHCPC